MSQVDLERLRKAYWATVATAVHSPAEQSAAREIIANAGPEAVDRIIERLNSEDCGGSELPDLVHLLTILGGTSAVAPLLKVFQKVAATWGVQAAIVEFLARIQARGAAVELAKHLEADYENTIFFAAFGLGLLGVDETRASLEKAFDRHGQPVLNALQRARTEFADSVLQSLDARKKSSLPGVSAMTDMEMLQWLRTLCQAYSANDMAKIGRLEVIATDIGKELDRRGGYKEMARVFSQLGQDRGARTLEMLWGGIGKWRG